jgi:hypothetical protein
MRITMTKGAFNAKNHATKALSMIVNDIRAMSGMIRKDNSKKRAAQYYCVA